MCVCVSQRERQVIYICVEPLLIQINFLNLLGSMASSFEDSCCEALRHPGIISKILLPIKFPVLHRNIREKNWEKYFDAKVKRPMVKNWRIEEYVSKSSNLCYHLLMLFAPPMMHDRACNVHVFMYVCEYLCV